MNASDTARHGIIERTLQDYLAAARMYRAVVQRVERFALLENDERLQDGKQVLSIVFGTCLGYISAGADALEAAAERMNAALGSAAHEQAHCDSASADAEAPQADPAATQESDPVASPNKPIDLARASEEFNAAGHMLHGLTYLLNSEAAELHDRSLTGDPHPYGDVLYGICVPYLYMASETLAAAAKEAQS